MRNEIKNNAAKFVAVKRIIRITYTVCQQIRLYKWNSKFLERQRLLETQVKQKTTIHITSKNYCVSNLKCFSSE